MITHLEGRPGTARQRKLEAARKAAGFGVYDDDDDYDYAAVKGGREAWIAKVRRRPSFLDIYF